MPVSRSRCATSRTFCMSWDCHLCCAAHNFALVLHDLRSGEGWIPGPSPPPTSRHNPFSAQSSGRIFPLVSRVVAAGLPTTARGTRPKSVSPGRYSPDLLTSGVLVGSLGALISFYLFRGNQIGFRRFLWVAKGSEVETLLFTDVTDPTY
jgi:hypothetical protein